MGDGRLGYRPETIGEAYYLVQLAKWIALTADYQFIADPGHNGDRGPVSVVSLRLHVEALASVQTPASLPSVYGATTTLP